MSPSQFLNTMVDRHALDYAGDNSDFISIFIPVLKLTPYDKRVMMWAYGKLGSDKSYEMESDGETVVKDMFLDGAVKSPAGVTHDYINRVKGHRTPDGKVWTAWECNALYRRVMKALGYGYRLRWRRWLGVTLTQWKWWRKAPKKEK